MNQKTLQKQKGFTIIETLFSIFILLLSITGPLTFAQSGLRASFLARDQITAFYLAQDSIETIKHLRDNYALGGGTGHWLTDLNGCKPENALGNNPGEAKSCRIDTSGATIELQSCSDIENSCARLYYDADSRKYTHNTIGTEISKYSRIVHVAEISQDREAQVVVEVEWENNFFSDRRIVVQENIYNWVSSFANQN